MVDAANVAALAALLAFRRPECSVGGADGTEVIMHPPEVGCLNPSWLTGFLAQTFSNMHQNALSYFVSL
jgi:hypothetical protein